MNEIIWNKDELKKINKIILYQSNLKITEDNMNIDIKSKSPMDSIFIEYQQEIIDLFYIQDRSIIENILIQASQVKADINNPQHFGLIMSLSKININDHSQIFEIFKQIISQYARIISSIVKNQMEIISKENNIETQINNLSLIIKDLKNNENNIYIQNAKKKITEVFKDANGIEKNEIFNSTIKKLDNEINERFIVYFNKKLNVLNNYNEILKTDDLKRSYIEHERKKAKKRKWSYNSKIFTNN